jgi:acetyl-CoA C-acetyltransferase
MREAVIVSTARTPIGRAYRGAFNDTDAPSLAGHAIRHAVERAGVEPAEVEDVVMGCALPQGSQAPNIARLAALRAGLPVTVGGMTVDRQCSSGMMAIAIAARSIVHDGFDIMVGGGLDSISVVQNEHMNTYRMRDPALVGMHPHIYMPMLDTAEVVARRYGISREAQDEYALQSQQRTAAAQAAGQARRRDRSPALAYGRAGQGNRGNRLSRRAAGKGRGQPPRHDSRGLAALKTVRDNGHITAGNASQLSDGASAAVVMEAGLAAKRGLQPLGYYRGTAVAGCEPDEMGIGPVFAVPKLLQKTG